MPPPQFASVPQGFPSGARHPVPLPRFASVPQGFPSGARHPVPLPRFASVPQGFPSGARHPVPLPQFASVPQGFSQVPGTRCRRLGLLAFLRVSLQVPGTRCCCRRWQCRDKPAHCGCTLGDTGFGCGKPRHDEQLSVRKLALWVLRNDWRGDGS